MCQIHTGTWQGKGRDEIMFSPFEAEQEQYCLALLSAVLAADRHLKEFISWDERKSISEPESHVAAAIWQCNTPARLCRVLILGWKGELIWEP